MDLSLIHSDSDSDSDSDGEGQNQGTKHRQNDAHRYNTCELKRKSTRKHVPKTGERAGHGAADKDMEPPFARGMSDVDIMIFSRGVVSYSVVGLSPTTLVR